MKKWLKPIKKMGACEDAIVWGNTYESFDEAWQACERGDWMLWLIGKLSGEPASDKRRKLVMCACQCARLALPYVSERETRPLTAIETAEKWANCVVGTTLDDVRAAAYAADVAYIAYAAYAAYTAYTYYADLYAASAVAHAAYAAYAAAKKDITKRCADIVRQYYGTDEVIDMLEAKNEI